MKKLLILGAGTAGTMMANHLGRSLDPAEWAVTIVDQHKTHYYQPGFLFIPFGTYAEKDVVRAKADFIPRGVRLVQAAAERIDRDKNEVVLKDGGRLAYDILIVATGARTAPEEIEGMTGPDWRNRVHDFYTLEGSLALAEKLKNWPGGRLLVHLSEMPIKCPVAPLEFTMLADSFFRERGIRDRVEISYVTPLSGAFTKQNCSRVLGHLLNDKGIRLEPDFAVARVDNDAHTLVSWDEKSLPYDLLVTVPTNRGDPVIGRSGLGDDLDFIPTHKHTLQSKAAANIFVIGDATDVPASKAGSVAHFEAEVLTDNIGRFIKGRELEQGFDGHANCFIESGNGRAFLIDFNYDIEPVEGAFPLPVVGPFKLLQESRLNHFGKLAFKWIYWNMLLKGRPLPGITTRMSRLGKKIPAEPAAALAH